MGAFSEGLQNVANTLLQTYGQTISFTRYAVGAYDTDTGTISTTSSSSFSAQGHPSMYKIDEIDGETIQQNDIQVIVYSTTEPQIEDEATVDSVVYRVMNVEILKAQGDAIVYRLQLRV